MMLKGLGEPVVYGPTDEQLGVPAQGEVYTTLPVGPGGEYPGTVVDFNPYTTSLPAAPSGSSSSSSKTFMLAALVFLGIVVLKTR